MNDLIEPAQRLGVQVDEMKDFVSNVQEAVAEWMAQEYISRYHEAKDEIKRRLDLLKGEGRLNMPQMLNDASKDALRELVADPSFNRYEKWHLLQLGPVDRSVMLQRYKQWWRLGYLFGVTSLLAKAGLAWWLTRWIYRLLIRSHIMTRILHFMKKPLPCSPNLRSLLREVPMATVKEDKAHSHPVSASLRDAASALCVRLAHNSGMDPFMVQMSAADVRRGLRGSRSWWWSKDVTVDPSDEAMCDDDLPILIDVDQYYDDMEAKLARWARPVLIYTFQPGSVAGVREDYSFTFDKDDNVEYRVTGGAVYKHKVWNYSHDTIITHTWSCWKGFNAWTTTYNVERRSVDKDHHVIFLIPTAHWRGVGALLAIRNLQGNRLARYRVATSKGFLRLAIHERGSLTISTGRVGDYMNAAIPAEEDDAMQSKARTSKFPLTQASVAVVVKSVGKDAQPLLEYYLSQQGHKPDYTCPVNMQVLSYQHGTIEEEDAKPSVSAYMNPLIVGCWAPLRSLANEDRTVSARVINVRAPFLTPSSQLMRYMEEFLSFMVPEMQRHELLPVDPEAVFERQAKPTQRRILERGIIEAVVREIKMFMKRETYGKEAPDPRPISQINGSDKRRYSQFMYSLEKVFKAQPWYAFGKTPKDIGERVSYVCSTAAKHVINSDFSRFDGHGSNVMRELERRLLTRAFSQEFHVEALELHRSQFGMKAVASYGTRYDQGYSRGSGSPETSLFNSSANAFVAYCALRSTRYNGQFYTPAEAYAKLGCYGGDDGLTPDVDEKAYVQAAADIGQVLATEPVRKGEMGVKFLARIYSPQVWYYDPTNCCDLPRQLAKFHATVVLPAGVSAQDKLGEKALSFYLTDRNTPIIGNLVRRAIGFLNPTAKQHLAEVRSWAGQYEEDVQYVNEPGDWMLAYAEHALPGFDFKRYEKWLEECPDVETLMHAPLFMEEPAPRVPTTYIVNGILYVPKDYDGQIEWNIPQPKDYTKTHPAEPIREPLVEVKEREIKTREETATEEAPVPDSGEGIGPQLDSKHSAAVELYTKKKKALQAVGRFIEPAVWNAMTQEQRAAERAKRKAPAAPAPG